MTAGLEKHELMLIVDVPKSISSFTGIIQYERFYKDVDLNVYTNAVKRLIASKITVFVYIIYVCVLCIFIMHTYFVNMYMHTQVKNKCTSII